MLIPHCSLKKSPLYSSEIKSVDNVLHKYLLDLGDDFHYETWNSVLVLNYICISNLNKLTLIAKKSPSMSANLRSLTILILIDLFSFNYNSIQLT